MYKTRFPIVAHLSAGGICNGSTIKEIPVAFISIREQYSRRSSGRSVPQYAHLPPVNGAPQFGQFVFMV
jgi:hypothetical protein